MKPTDFQYRNIILKPPVNGDYSENVESIVDLPAWSDGEQCVSCWKPSWRERLSILFFGRIWLSILNGDTPPSPVSISGVRRYFRVVAEKGDRSDR